MTRLEVFEKLFEIEDKGIPNSDWWEEEVDLSDMDYIWRNHVYKNNPLNDHSWDNAIFSGGL